MLKRDKKLEKQIKEQKELLKDEVSDETSKVIEVITNTIELYRRYRYPEIYAIIKAKYLFAGDMRMELNLAWDTNATAEVYPLIWPIHDTFNANLYDTIMSPRVSARNADDQELAESWQAFLDWAQDISNSVEAKQLMNSEASLIGTSFWMWGWLDVNEEVEVSLWEWKTITIKDKRSIPTMEHVPYFEMFYDIGTRDFYNARWKARRKIMSSDSVIERYKAFLWFAWLTKEEAKIRESALKRKFNDNVWDAISPYDFNKIYSIKSYEYLFDEEIEVDTSKLMDYVEENILTTVTEENQFVEVIEFYEKDKLRIIINGHEEYCGPSPYPLKDPFGIVTHEKQFWTCNWIGIGQKLLPYQRQANMYWCTIKDALIQQLKPMYQYEWAVLDIDWQPATVISHIPNKMWKVDGKLAPMTVVNDSAIQYARAQFNEIIAKAWEAIWVNSYTQWGQGKVERSLGAANLKVAVTMTRLKPLNHSMWAFEQRIFEQWLMLAAIKLDEEVTVKILDKYGNSSFKTIKPQDLLNKFDITVDVDALRDITRNEKAQWAMNLLNAVASYNVDPISNTPAIAPETIISFLAQELDFPWLQPMTAEEREAYVNEKLYIAKNIQSTQWQAQPPIPWQAPMQWVEQVQPVPVMWEEEPIMPVEIPDFA